MGELEVTIERLAAMITLHAAGPVNGRASAALHEPLLAAASGAQCHSVPRSSLEFPT